MKCLFALLVLIPSLAHADRDASKRHYDAGAALYEATRYEAALREFEEAQAAEPHPALVFNIARCLDRLGRREEAAAAYNRFLAESKDSDAAELQEAQEARNRILALSLAPASETTVTSPPPTLTNLALPPPPSKKRFLGPGLLAGGALALGAVGAGLTGSAIVSYNHLSTTCSPHCDSSSWSSLPGREHAGEALMGVAAAALVGDIVWFIVASRRK